MSFLALSVQKVKYLMSAFGTRDTDLKNPQIKIFMIIFINTKIFIIIFPAEISSYQIIIFFLKGKSCSEALALKRLMKLYTFVISRKKIMSHGTHHVKVFKNDVSDY